MRSRRELRLINSIMGNHRWIARELASGRGSQRSVLELGAGDGSLIRELCGTGEGGFAEWSAVDLAPRPPEWPEGAPWHQGDVFEMERLPEAEVVVANLFLHHFENAQLRWMGGRLPQSCRLFLANEPARARFHSVQGRILAWVAGFGRVTCHDMDRSIRAGFWGDELPQALGLDGWQVKVSCTPLGAYRMRAWR